MTSSTRRRATAAVASLALVLSGAATGALATTAAAAPVRTAVEPEMVNIPGDHQDELGCAADWAPDCAETAMTQRPDGVWELVADDLPAGEYEFKIAFDGTWDRNVGSGWEQGGDNLAYTHDGGPITFYYDPVTNYFFNTSIHPAMTLPGSYQNQVGCTFRTDDAGSWDPACMATLLTDLDGDGIFTFVTDGIAPGEYETKVTYHLSWTENYGEGGAAGGANIPFSVGEQAVEFRFDPATKVLTVGGQVTGVGGLNRQAALWVDTDLIAVPPRVLGGVDPADLEFRLLHAPEGGIALDEEGAPVLPAAGGVVPVTFDAAGVPDDVREGFWHTRGHVALRLDVPDAELREILTGQVVLEATAADEVRVFTGLQIPGVLDSLYADDAADRPMGVTWADGVPSVALWAPTAKDVTLLLWPGADVAAEPQRVTMARQADGAWIAGGDAAWKGGAYRFEVDVYVPSERAVVTNVVTDPASVGLTLNSTHSVLVDLADPAFRPEAWESAGQPVVRPVDQTIYELHVRDFSWHDESVPEALRGTYLAFAEEDTAGRNHLRALAEAGLTTVHLLPTFDIATIEEDPEARAVPEELCDLEAMAPDSPEQQACIEEHNDLDGFNWGYDPYHFNTPEGSYATDAFGGARVAEFRTMVGALHGDGLQVVLDQVYNHTNASGQAERSVLDKVVPGYYHRLNDVGVVETSTCCQNLATEHEMAEKFMVDSMVVWARDYKVDGFRFDLMGHHSRANMESIRAALDELTPEADGVDGSAIYLYGEGWNFGEVVDDARFRQARQGNLGGTQIGTFSDRLRDAVRGGGPFDEDPRVFQGFGTGAGTDPNGLDDRPESARLAQARHQADLVRLGMAGNLRDFELLTSSGVVRPGSEIDYNGQPAGYADSPEEIITYVDKHDNETLFDILTLKLPRETSMDDRVRMNTVSLATVALAQTPAFFHAGSDLLRSKSLDRNSYDSGDWFNLLDFTGQDNGYARGLPRAADNQGKWPFMRDLLADESLLPSPEHIGTAADAYQDLLRLRFSTDLFRLGDAELIQEKVTFPNGGAEAAPGVVVMSVDDLAGDTDVDPALSGVLVVLNASPETYTARVQGHGGWGLELSEVQADGADETVRATTWEQGTGTVSVPARTVAVLVEPEGARGEPVPTDPVVTMTPTRVLDERSATVGTPVCFPVRGQHGVAEDATGLLVNVTSVRPNGLGYAVVYPDPGDGTVPEGSTVNFERGRDVANAAFVGIGENGQICYYTEGSRQVGVLVDVTGYVREGSGVHLQATERLVDTRPGAHREGPLAGPVTPHRVHTVQVTGEAGVPEDATSVLVNVTVTGATALGHLKVFPAGGPLPGTSTVNYAPGQDKANAAVVRLSDRGRLSFWSDTLVGTADNPVQVILDVVGWTTEGTELHGTSPRRIVDSRAATQRGELEGPLAAREVHSIQVRGRGGVPEGATAAVLNVTAIRPTTLGHLRVYPDTAGDGTTPSPDTSTVNYVPGRDIPNLIVVALPENGVVNLWSEQDGGGTVDVAVDVVGYVGGPPPAVVPFRSTAVPGAVVAR